MCLSFYRQLAKRNTAQSSSGEASSLAKVLDAGYLDVDPWRTDKYGREQTRTVNLTIDIRDFKDKAGFAYLVMAANPGLSVRDTQEVLAAVAEQHERPIGWISRRRWLFHGAGKAGAKQNADGLDEKAFKIIEENSPCLAVKWRTCSARVASRKC